MINRNLKLLILASTFLLLICISTIVSAVNVTITAKKQTNGDVKITIGIPSDAPMAAYYTVIKGSSTETPTEEEYISSNFGIYPGVSTDVTIPANDSKSQGNKLYVWVKAIDDDNNETQISSGQEVTISLENDNNNSDNNNNSSMNNNNSSINNNNVIQSSSNNTTSTSNNDLTTSNNELSKTGIANNVILSIIVVSIVGLISYIRYKKYNF